MSNNYNYQNDPDYHLVTQRSEIPAPNIKNPYWKHLKNNTYKKRNIKKVKHVIRQ